MNSVIPGSNRNGKPGVSSLFLVRPDGVVRESFTEEVTFFPLNFEGKLGVFQEDKEGRELHGVEVHDTTH